MQMGEMKNDMNAEEYVDFDVETEGFSFSLNSELTREPNYFKCVWSIAKMNYWNI